MTGLLKGNFSLTGLYNRDISFAGILYGLCRGIANLIGLYGDFSFPGFCMGNYVWLAFEWGTLV